MKKQKNLIKFNNEDEEFEFWSKTDSIDYINRSTIHKGKFPDLKMTTQNLTLNIPVSLIERVKIEANKCNIPFQELMKLFIIKGVQAQQRKK